MGYSSVPTIEFTWALILASARQIVTESNSVRPGGWLDNVLGTPHIGYVSHGLYKTFYEDTVPNIRKWLDTHP